MTPLPGASSSRYTPFPRPRTAATSVRGLRIPDIMKRLTPAVQRIILAFTTGLFLACAAQVSGQSGGLSATFQSVAP